MFKYIVLLALVPAILATEGVSPCRNQLPMPDYINVAGCERAPCQVQLGTNAEMTLGFTSPSELHVFTASVQAGVLGLWIDYALPENIANACNHLQNTRCPLSAGEDVVYEFLFPVEDNYPRISVDVELLLSGGGIGGFMCVTVPIRVIDAAE